MFLDRENGLNEYVGRIDGNGPHLFVYGHAKEQRDERFARTQDILNHKLLEWDALVQRCIELVIPRYKRCMNDRNAVNVEERKRMRNIIRDEVYLECGGKLFIVDLGILVKGTEVEFLDKYVKNVLPQYKNLYNKGILKLGDKVVAIETIMATIRLVNQDNRNFGNHHTLCNLGLNLPKNKPIKVTKKELVNIAKPMLKAEEEVPEYKQGYIVTKEVRKIVEKYIVQLEKKEKVAVQ